MESNQYSYQVDFYGSIFDKKIIGKKGDFSHMIKNETKRILYIYNENLSEWKNFNSLVKGGGNALLRPYRYDSPQNHGKWPRSIGIPTGPNWTRLTANIKQIIDQSVIHIENILLADNYDEVWWSSDNNGFLGVSIFQPHIDVIKYITMKIMNLAKSINGEEWMHYFNYYPENKVNICHVLDKHYPLGDIND